MSPTYLSPCAYGHLTAPYGGPSVPKLRVYLRDNLQFSCECLLASPLIRSHLHIFLSPTHICNDTPRAAGPLPLSRTHSNNDTPRAAGPLPLSCAHSYNDTPRAVDHLPLSRTHSYNDTPRAAGLLPLIRTHSYNDAPRAAVPFHSAVHTSIMIHPGQPSPPPHLLIYLQCRSKWTNRCTLSNHSLNLNCTNKQLQENVSKMSPWKFYLNKLHALLPVSERVCGIYSQLFTNFFLSVKWNMSRILK